MSISFVPPLTGRVVLVTGAGQGIGEQTARECALHGAIVVVADINAGAADQVAKSIRALGQRAASVRIDVTDTSSIAQAVREARSHGPIYGLVNNAGTVTVGGFLGTPDDDFYAQFTMNCMGAVRLTREVLPEMISCGTGSIVNIASIGAVVAVPERVAYGVSKGALLSFSRAVAQEFAASGIRCNAILPVRVATPSALERAGRDEKAHREMFGTQASGKMIGPKTVAAMAALFLNPTLDGLNGEEWTASDCAVAELRLARTVTDPKSGGS